MGSREYLRSWHEAHPEAQAKYSKDWRSRLTQEQHERYKASQRERYSRRREEIRASQRRRRFELKNLAILTYGGVCVCCGESRALFLTIDHVDGGGNDHKRKAGYGNVYAWLSKNNYPKGFQILCAGCNVLKGYYGECPHKNYDKIAGMLGDGLALVSRKRSTWNPVCS